MENFESNKVNKQDGPILRSRQRKRSFQENRPIKRLFTPEIKRHLKSWLIRRRENPYPNREEKIKLAEQTGLTYIQVSRETNFLACHQKKKPKHKKKKKN